ncbi:amidohydrolase family protein [Apiosordaria backusii]|uniref:Amidohydrolase family protein n=1 Tax=Apiosordaria backusii TaxID=314023 RepID=A0AA40DWW3_9PEZI|nr:amidohydrolase family protein [Apiosordaria backusii]
MHANHLGVLLSGLLVSATSASASSILFSGGTVIAFNRTSNSLEVIRNGSVLVTDDRITSVFANSSPPSSVSVPSDVEEVDITDKILTPGFIDTHRHGWQTAYKTLGSNTSLVDYFNRFGEFATAALYPLDSDEVYYSQLAGLYESLNAGVTTTLDHAHHTFSDSTSLAGLRASIDSGARVFWAYAFHNVTNYTLEQQFANYRSIASNASYSNTPTTLGVAYDGFGPNPNTTIITTLLDLIRESNASVLTTHSVAGPYGVTNSPEDFSSLSLFSQLPPTTPVVFSHASFLSPVGAQLLRTHNHTISITPESEMHYGHTHPTSHLIQDFASLGVDTHFTFSTDILTQARLWLQSVRRLLYTQVLDRWEVPVNNPMSANQAFLLATRNGGVSLRRDDLGVIAPGAKADLVIWDGTSPGMLGWWDPVAAVILHANVGDVEGVLVDGRWKKRDGRIVDKKYEEVKERFLEIARAVQERVIARAGEIGLPKEGERFQSGFEFGNTTTVDVVPGDGEDGYGGLFL